MSPSVGFSFGGMLACCVMANLWQESQISAEDLQKQAMCITFGQPFMKIQLVDEVLRICPEFKKSIHSVFLKDDLFPQIMGYVSLSATSQHREQTASRNASQAPDGTKQVCLLLLLHITHQTRDYDVHVHCMH